MAQLDAADNSPAALRDSLQRVSAAPVLQNDSVRAGRGGAYRRMQQVRDLLASDSSAVQAGVDHRGAFHVLLELEGPDGAAGVHERPRQYHRVAGADVPEEPQAYRLAVDHGGIDDIAHSRGDPVLHRAEVHHPRDNHDGDEGIGTVQPLSGLGVCYDMVHGLKPVVRSL